MNNEDWEICKICKQKYTKSYGKYRHEKNSIYHSYMLGSAERRKRNIQFWGYDKYEKLKPPKKLGKIKKTETEKINPIV